ncbi:DUF3786 domain-containing protein [Lacrimispora sp. NSJ-141]|uniref:DUF3786 domain-containing protein n=1 Tax=Lientehia hominis TaxID=2897778 RepID=A0AAP2RJF4_9FIRM|nr:DUF3786 domain-containing protein [Lientehia hominis]MCD2492725.1 DUF3786 domain-containing protein [Lientehia hominis]
MNIPYEKNQKDRVPFEQYKKKFAGADASVLSSVSGVPYEEETGLFTLTLMNKMYTVHHPDFEVACLDNEADCAPLLTDIETKILIIRYLLESRKAAFKGTFYAYADMPWGNHYNQVFQGRCVKRLAFTFGFQMDKFCRVMESVGGKKIPAGDAGYEFAFLDDLRLQFVLWEGDEEFPPSAQILFSDNFSFAFQAEDMAAVGDISIGTLKTLAKSI